MIHWDYTGPKFAINEIGPTVTQDFTWAKLAIYLNMKVLILYVKYYTLAFLYQCMHCTALKRDALCSQHFEYGIVATCLLCHAH